MNGYRLAAVCDSRMFGGAERVLEVLLGALPAAVAVTVVGHDPAVVGRLAAARPDSAAVVVPPGVCALRRALRDAAPDVAHMNLTSMRSCRPAIAASLTLRIPTVLVDHLPMPGLRLRGRVLQRLFTRLSAARVSVGEGSSRRVEAIVGLAPGTVRTVHNGVPPLDVAPPSPADGWLRVATLSRLVSQKGVDVLLRALAQVPEVCATVAGAGPLEPDLRRLAAELGLAERVRFPGWADPTAVLAGVDAVVLPSRNEGLPLVLLEAMQAGFPVLATRVGSIAEAVEDGVSGLLVEPDDETALADQLRRLAAEPALRSRLGAAARGRARRSFSPEAMATAYDALYREVSGRDRGVAQAGFPNGPSTRPRALVTLPEPAAPTDTGKRLRASAMVRALGAVADLEVVVLHADHPLDLRPVPDDVPVGRWVVVRKRRFGRLRAVARMVRGLPWQAALQDWTGPRAEVARLATAGYDLVWFGALDHFVLLRDLLPGVPAVVDYDDVEPVKLRAYLAVAPRDLRGRLRRVKARVDAVAWRRFERLAARHAEAVVVCSDLDLARLLSARGVAVPNTYPDPVTVRQRVPAGPAELLMIANYGYVPNVDAARFAVDEVLPAVRRVLPDACLHLAGRGADVYMGDLATVDGVRVTGTVPAVRPLLDAAIGVIAPVRYGGGTRLKIIEAFAHGVPVVSTTLGAEGLRVTDGVDVLLADDGSALAEACVRVATDMALNERLARAGRRLYEAEYQPAVADRIVADLVRTVLARRAARE
jgi:glycosyltransferase involved in cell wall biosynthesis